MEVTGGAEDERRVFFYQLSNMTRAGQFHAMNFKQSGRCGTQKNKKKTLPCSGQYGHTNNPNTCRAAANMGTQTTKQPASTKIETANHKCYLHRGTRSGSSAFDAPHQPARHLHFRTKITPRFLRILSQRRSDLEW